MKIPMLRTPLLCRIATLSALAVIALSASSQANAQKVIFDVNKLYGKSYAEVEKMLGKPMKSYGSPKDYGIWKVPGLTLLSVWWRSDTHLLKQVQIQLEAPQGEPESIAKKLGVTIGPDPLKFTRGAPSLAVTSRNLPANMKWGKVYVGYTYPMPYQADLIEYCKKKGLKPNSTYFWTLQVNPRRGAPSGRQVSAGGKG
jgi:hypothetical protein